MKNIILLYLLLNSIYAFPKDGFDFKSLNVKTGLANNTVNSICRDSYGFIWFATNNGLSRYDGYNFKNYYTALPGSHHNQIFNIGEDNNGNIWMHTADGLFHYNREKDVLEKNIQSILSWLNISDNIEQLFVDHDQNIWCVTGTKLIYYNYKEKQKRTFPLPKNERIKWLECRGGRAYILFDSGVVGNVDFKSNNIGDELSVELSSHYHHRIYLDQSFNLWFYTAYAPGNMLRMYNPQTKLWKVLNTNTKLTFDFITSIIDVGNGNIWIGTVEKGVFIYQTDTDSFIQLTNEKNNPFSLPSNHISCFYKDQEDIVWVGTSKRGVAHTSLNNIVFERDNLSEFNDISCIVEDTDGNLWLGSDGDGILRVNASTNERTRFNIMNGTIPTNLIVCSFLDSKNRIWFGTYGGGAFYYDKGNFVHLNNNDQQTMDLLKDIRSIEEDAAGNIWLGTIDKGLFCYDKKGNIQRYTMDNSGLPTNSITDLHFRSGQFLDIGTGSGMCSMNTVTRQVNVVKSNARGTQQIPENLISCIYRDSRNLLWIGGHNGLYVFDNAQDTIFHLTSDNGISHNYIRGIVEDQNKNIWITTDFGITNIVVVNDPMSKTPIFRCYRYYDGDGIGDIAFNYHSIFCNKKGEILMGGIGGYVKTIPDLIRYKQPHSKVVFTALYINNNHIDVGESVGNGRIILSDNIQLINEITLDYSDNNFSIDVSSMNYESPRKTTYSYRLSNDGQWTKLTGNTIYFNELSVGVYDLQVRASNDVGHWIAEPSTLTIRVMPPFWLSSPAYIFYMLLFCITIFAIIISARKKIKFKMQMQGLKINLAKEHEINETKMRFFDNISHDLRTPLSLIITPIEKLLGSEVSNKSIQEDLELMHRNAVLMMDEVNQLLDLRRLDKNKSELILSHGNLPEFIKEVCYSFECIANKKGIRLNVILKASSIRMDFDKNKIKRIMMNLLSNAFKYNNENGSIAVTVDRVLGTEGELAKIQVADTGIGIHEENKKRIFERFYQEPHPTTYKGSGIGLHIVKEYILMHNGKIEVMDNNPHGSIVIITLPISNTIEQAVQKEVKSNVEVMEDNTEDLPILVVEDNDDFRQFLINCLKTNYKVIAVPDGKKALKLMAKQPVRLVISDIMMPEMDGLELCNCIKGDLRFSHIPVILLTARTTDEHIQEGLKEGADDYITKPFNLGILLLRVNRIIEWGKNNHKRFKEAEIEPSEITISSLDELLIKNAITLVEKNMSNTEYSVEELSTAVGMSRGHFYKKLMAITGKAPLEFIRILRIKRGRQLIEKSQLNVSEIAYKVGISPKQFTKYFKEMYGELPSSYKKK